ncbi:MAG: hypothetical protein AAF902_22885 [Chloroflexota bacterium]
MLVHRNDIEEFGRRKWSGTIISGICLFIILGTTSWYAANWLLFESDLLSTEMLYRGGFSRDLSETSLLLIVTATVFVLSNFFVLIGYFFALPSGRRRSNEPSTYSRRPERYR